MQILVSVRVVALHSVVKTFLMLFSPSIFLADDVWLLPLSGHLSLCVHSASPQSDSGPFTTPHVALLWSQVNLIVHYSDANQKEEDFHPSFVNFNCRLLEIFD